MFIYGNFCHVASNDRWQNQSSIFLYKTIDTLQQMTTAGYFNRAKLDLHIGDIIFATVETIQETTTYDTYVFRVLTVNEPITVEQISLGEVQAAAITTDTTLTGTGTADSPLGIAQSVKDSIDGKLPLAGGELVNGADVILPGALRFINETSTSQYWDITCEDGWNMTFACPSSARKIKWAFTTNSLRYYGVNPKTVSLGDRFSPFSKAYVAALNNGADITIPTTGGTMALLSDIPSGVTTDSSLSGAGTEESPLQISSTVLGELETLNTSVNTLDGDVTDLGNQVTEIQSSVNTLSTTVEDMAATVSSNVFTENLGNNIVRISGTESFGVLAQQGTSEHPITLPMTLADANYVVQTTATSANGMCEIVSGFSARTTTGFTIGVRNLATAAEATDVAVCWSIIGQKA